MAFRLKYTRPIIYLLIAFLIASVLTTVAFSRLDAIQFKDYVGFLQKECWGTNPNSPQGNTDKICIDAWNNLGIPAGDQKDIPNAYWKSMEDNLLLIAGVIGGLWLAISLINDKVHNTKPDPIVIYFTIVIVLTIIMPIWTAWGDYFYFIWLGIAEPPTWQWLDNAGVFPWLLQQTHESDVSLNDMYIAMAMGIGIIVAIWTPIVIIFAISSKNKIKNLI